MVRLTMPAWAIAVDCEDTDVDSWDQMVRQQLRRQGADWWEQYEEGDVLAVEDRTTWSQPWPGNRRFVLFVDDERLALFDDEGWPVDDPRETPGGLITRAEWDCEFASNMGDYYRIPPASSLSNPTAGPPDLAAFFSAEVEGAALEQQIGMLPPQPAVTPPASPDNARAAAPSAAAASAPSAADAIRSSLAKVGARVLLAGEQGAAFVFATTKAMVCVAYDRLD